MTIALVTTSLDSQRVGSISLRIFFENLATAPEVLGREIQRPALNEVKDSVNRLTMAGLLETDGIRCCRPSRGKAT